jgi:hypothetical protein
VERSVARRVGFVHIRSGRAQHVGHVGLPGHRRPHEQGPLKRAVASVCRGPGCQPLLHAINVTGHHRRHHRLPPLAVDHRVDQPFAERDDRDRAHGQRHENASDPLPQKGPQATAAEDEHCEEAAQQKEERHAEAMHRREENGQEAALADVVHRPHASEEAHRRVQGDAQQHREAAEGVEIAASLARFRSGRRWVGHGGMNCFR